MDHVVSRAREEIFLEYAKSICPVCKRVVDGEVNIRAGKVYLRKRCPDHGEFEALVYGDADMYIEALRFNKPGTIPLTFQTETHDGCPLDCGLCPDHKQHACVALIEVNTHCNLDCPICFADSGHQPDGFTLTREQVETCIDSFVQAEGRPEVLMFSGGEPTIHPEILSFMALAKEKGVQTIILNTNGLRLASDANFARRIRELGPGIGIYLQFDGLEPETDVRIRGKDLRRVKQRALQACQDAGLSVALVAAVEHGVNDHELGAIIRFGVGHPAVRGVVLQPVTHTGRHLEFDPGDRLTNSDVIHAIAEQLPDWFRSSDFFPVPCCFPTCRSVTYALAQDTTVIPVTRLIEVGDYLDYVTNRALPDPAVRDALERLWSAGAFTGTPLTDEHLERLGCTACSTSPELLEALSEQAFMIMVQDFQDAYTLSVKQVMKCCVVELVPDGRIIPFCAYNSVGYREQVREQLSGIEVANVVPNARELHPQTVTTRHGSKTHAGTLGASPPDTRNIGKRLPVQSAERIDRQAHNGFPAASQDATEPDDIKRCCAATYELDLVGLLLGESYHPGGLDLTRRLGQAAAIEPGSRILDVACGPGASARLFAAEFEADVVASDLGADTVRRASAADGRLDYCVADAEHLPWRDESFDVLISECALCTFPDKARAIEEATRILRPGGRFALTDVTLQTRELPSSLAGLAGWVACLGGALPFRRQVELLETAGLRVTAWEHHDDALRELVNRVTERLLDLIEARLPHVEGLEAETVVQYTQEAKTAIDAGIAGYSLIVAQKATPPR